MLSLISEEKIKKNRRAAIRQHHPSWIEDQIEEYAKKLEKEKEQSLCWCNCGNLAKSGNKFIYGHQRRGKPGWTKGLTKETDDRIAKMSKKIGLALLGSHPKKIIHTDEEKESWPNFCQCNCGQRCREKFVHGHNGRGKRIIFSKEHNHNLSLAKKGKTAWSKGLTREIDRRIRIQSEDEKLNRVKNRKWERFSYAFPDGTILGMRSSWEVLYAEHLDSLNVVWLYESRIFKLSNGHSYIPDFFISELNEYHEVKGWMSPKDREKINLFRNDYPNETLIVVTKNKAKTEFCIMVET